MINVDANVKNALHVKKYYVWNPVTCNCEKWKIFSKYYG